MSVSIIIPVLNEEQSICATLERLQVFRQQGCEVIVVDAGSVDNTDVIAAALSDQLITSGKGRALQMNLGASHAQHDILWFLHADTLVPENAIDIIESSLTDREWGRFNVKLSGAHGMFRIIELMMNIRSCITAIATGDQGIFVKHTLFSRLGGYPEIPLMEDIALSKKLKQVSRPVCIKDNLVTSSRRWEEKGIMKTVLLMWKLRFLYFIGVSADDLARQY
jgi:rSAM/selenodomain-associated transferase 2